MEGSKDFKIADDFTNPRGDSITKPEVVQAINDITNSFKKCGNLHLELSKVTGASVDQLASAASALKVKLPEHFVTLYEKYNGGFNFNNWVTFTLDQIVETQKELSVNGMWKNGFVLVGKNEMENNYLLIDTSEGGKVLSWAADDGVDEQLDKDIGLFLEKFSNMLLASKLEYDSSIGFMSIA